MGVSENHAAPTDKVTQAGEAIEELRAEFGLQVLMEAVLKSEIGEKLAGNPLALRRVIITLLREIVYANDSQLEAEIMAISVGVLDDRGIMTRIAEKRGVSRAAISKRARAFIHEWGLPPSAAMKSEEACSIYSARNQPRL